MEMILDHRKVYGLFHAALSLKVNSILDFGGSLARNTMFSRRYWMNIDEHIDISRETRLDSFDLFGLCHFSVFQHLYNIVYNDLNDIVKRHYDLIAFIDIFPYLETDVIFELLTLLKSHCFFFVIQLSEEVNVPPEQWEHIGRCWKMTFSSYDFLLIQTNSL